MYRINSLAITRKTKRVYSAVRTVSLSIMQVTLLLELEFPCQFHSTEDPHSSSSTRFSYQKEKGAKSGTLSTSNGLSFMWEHWI